MLTFQKSFERTLTARESKQHIPFPVQVPPGTAQINISFAYSPLAVEGIHNLLTLSVFDPSGWRGAGHRHGERHEIVLTKDRASPGFMPGAVQAGTWTVVVDAHVVMPGPPCVLRLDVTGNDDPAPGPVIPRKTNPGRPARGRGWYRGDLHAHTLHSDADWDVPELVAYARSQRLDFATLTDHNTVSGLAEMDAAGSEALLTMGGMEMTTFWGHALALGPREWIDWRTSEERTMDQIAAEVAGRGGLLIIAHPMSIGDPFCSGCDWGFPTLRPGQARAVEVWNGDWDSDSNNEAGLRLAFDWLNAGYRLALTAGTDNHGVALDRMRYGFDVVLAEELSEGEILRAVQLGHLYLSAGPRLELHAVAGGQRAMLGDALSLGRGAVARLRADWGDCPVDARLEWVVDGETRESFPAGAQGSKTWEIAGSQARWCLVTLRAASGQMLALTNPIYLDGRA